MLKEERNNRTTYWLLPTTSEKAGSWEAGSSAAERQDGCSLLQALHIQLPTSEQMYVHLTVLRSNVLLLQVRDGWTAQIRVWGGGREEPQIRSYRQTMLLPRRGKHLVAIGLRVTSNDSVGETSSPDGGIPSSCTRNTHPLGRGKRRLQKQLRYLTGRQLNLWGERRAQRPASQVQDCHTRCWEADSYEEQQVEVQYDWGLHNQVPHGEGEQEKTVHRFFRKQQQASLAGGMFETSAKHRGVVQCPAARHSGG